jgi:TolB-like protein/Tfp pilus assembly protein PilF
MRSEQTGVAPSFAGDFEPSVADIRLCLAKLLTSHAFRASLRRKKFLDYIVTETLAGTASRLKAFDIAVAALGRDESFDPQIDPIVRLEARRLRRDLEHYYLTEGAGDPIRITIPKGGYVPAFEACGPVQATAPPAESPIPGRRRLFPLVLLACCLLFVTVAAGVWWWRTSSGVPDTGQQRGPVVVVLPFETTGEGMQAGLAAGLTNDLVAELRRFDQLRLFAPDRAVALDAVPVLLAKIGQPVGYTIGGMLQQDETRLRVTARLADAGTGEIIWSEILERQRDVPGMLALQADLAARLAAKIGQPYGIVHQASVDRLRQSVPSSLYAYACVQQAYEYRRVSALQRYPSVRACLEEAVRRDPGYADAWAMLAGLHQTAWLFGLAPAGERAAELERWREAAEHAYRSAPENILSLQALATVRYFGGDFAEAERLIRQALTLSPNDPETLVQLGWRTLVRGKVEEGERLVRQAIERSVVAPTWYHVAAGYGAYLRGDYATALADGAQAKGALAGQDIALLAMTYGQLGDLKAAKATLEHVKAEAPWLEKDPAVVYRMFHIQPVFIERFLDGLHKAGLEVAAEATPGTP